MAIDQITPAAVIAARDAWHAAMGARDDHQAACCGNHYRTCAEGVALERAEDAAWHRYFDARHPGGHP